METYDISNDNINKVVKKQDSDNQHQKSVCMGWVGVGGGVGWWGGGGGGGGGGGVYTLH